LEVEPTGSGESANASLDELPELVMIPLGTRGVQRIKLKHCQYCSNDDPSSLKLLERSVKNLGEGQDAISYLVLCERCSHRFTFHCRNVYSTDRGEKKRVVSFVSVLDEEGKDQGWLGNF